MPDSLHGPAENALQGKKKPGFRPVIQPSRPRIADHTCTGRPASRSPPSTGISPSTGGSSPRPRRPLGAGTAACPPPAGNHPPDRSAPPAAATAAERQARSCPPSSNHLTASLGRSPTTAQIRATCTSVGAAAESADSHRCTVLRDTPAAAAICRWLISRSCFRHSLNLPLIFKRAPSSLSGCCRRYRCFMANSPLHGIILPHIRST